VAWAAIANWDPDDGRLAAEADPVMEAMAGMRRIGDAIVDLLTP
jgi:hypothetical protein